MTTTEPPPTLARREMTLSDIATRLRLNAESGWGLERATTPQLNSLALFCQRYQLLPGDEVTLYDGKPWITVDGRVTLMRRNKNEYRGHSQRPLSAAEKQDWGWDPDDIVIETTVRTVTYGEIKAYGRVSKAERAGQAVQGVRHNAVAKHHGVEIAQKRSLSRGERLAFGTDTFIDEKELEQVVQSVITEQRQPERVAANVAKYHQIYGQDEDGTMFDLPADQVVEHVSQEPTAISKRDELAQLLNEARRRNLTMDVQPPHDPEVDPLDAAIGYWRQRIQDFDDDQRLAGDQGPML